MTRAITGQKGTPAGTATPGPRPQTTVRQCLARPSALPHVLLTCRNEDVGYPNVLCVVGVRVLSSAD